MNALRAQLEPLVQHPNVRGFAAAVRLGEGTTGPDGYRTLFGGGLFDSFADHPRQLITRKLGGKPISSTAAGAYQFLSRTWDECRAALGLGDFSPHCQELAFLFLVRRRKALDDVLAGRIREAIHKCRLEWASLPGSPYGQPTKTMDAALAAYTAAGGQFAPAVPAAPAAPAPPAAQPAANPVAKEAPVAPLIPMLAGTLLEIFTPLAKEKLTKEMTRHTGTPEVAEKIADGVIAAAKTVTGTDDPIEAVAAVRKDPELVARVEALSLDQLDGVLTLAERMSKIDEASVKAAREYARSDDFMIDTPWIRLKFIHLLSITFVSFAGWFVVQTWATLTPELRGAVITLMVIAGWNGVRDFWMGSSDGSQRKTTELIKQARSDNS